MSTQTAAAIAALIHGIDWDDPRLNPQAIVDAQKQGLLRGPLTDYLVSQNWNLVQKAQEVKVYLKRVFEDQTMTVGISDGTEKFEGSDLFGDRVYGLALPEVMSPSTPTNFILHDLVKNGKFTDFLPTLGENRPRLKNRGQVMRFCRDHKDKLSRRGATLFELEGGFVARVFFDVSGRLRVGVDGFSYGGVWHARYESRVVSPQQ